MQTQTNYYHLSEQGISAAIIERFWNNLVIVPYDKGCWLWTAGKSSGYGAISRFPKSPIRTHVLSFMLHRGPVPKGMQVCHTCDVKICVRPDHLWLGTMADNQADKISKHRQNRLCPWSRGETNGHSKLTAGQVIEMRSLFESGGKLVNLAARFGISDVQVANIVYRKQWAHI